MTLETRPWDVTEHLRTEDDLVGYLAACFDEAPEDAAFIAHALGDCARARGNWSKLARDTGISREGLYKSLSANGNPSFATVLKVARAIGLQLAFVARPSQAPRKPASARRVAATAVPRPRTVVKPAPAKKAAAKKTRRG